ncbi:MAG: hypothetical protein FI681_03380 [SAR202 cluster bacterium]|jgi:hypothetical protein|uniref:Uncharacterized protein n=1 Tax=marine metagenome TaxID=408172 RepID=A0A382QBN2_9ZZZZ|nr:hypothetical protein [SAR202 cluster bacterium]|tara:strand:- start:752 stop:931 length:180 start_codon:yes stop_codon:yes gene_type:complete
MAKSNLTFLTIWALLFVSVILIGSWSLAESATRSMGNKNYTDNELTLVQKSAIFICPLH